MSENTLTKENVTPEKAMEMSPWDLATLFGFNFSGDMNPFDHGGYFYDLRDWGKDGYVNTVGFSIVDDKETWLETGCIDNREDVEKQIRSDYSHESEETLKEMVENPSCQVETCGAYWPKAPEIIETYEAEDSGDDGELECWKHIVETLKNW